MNAPNRIPGPIIDYPFDTTRCAVQMVLNGVLDRNDLDAAMQAANITGGEGGSGMPAPVTGFGGAEISRHARLKLKTEAGVQV